MSNVDLWESTWRTLSHSMATEGLLTHIVTGKFCVSLPLYRKKRIFRRMEADVLGNYLDLVEATSDNNPVENAICIYGKVKVPGVAIGIPHFCRPDSPEMKRP